LILRSERFNSSRGQLSYRFSDLFSEGRSAVPPTGLDTFLQTPCTIISDAQSGWYGRSSGGSGLFGFWSSLGGNSISVARTNSSATLSSWRLGLRGSYRYRIRRGWAGEKLGLARTRFLADDRPALSQPFPSARSIADDAGCSQPTVTALLTPFVRNGELTETGQTDGIEFPGESQCRTRRDQPGSVPRRSNRRRHHYRNPAVSCCRRIGRVIAGSCRGCGPCRRSVCRQPQGAG